MRLKYNREDGSGKSGYVQIDLKECGGTIRGKEESWLSEHDDNAYFIDSGDRIGDSIGGVYLVDGQWEAYCLDLGIESATDNPYVAVAQLLSKSPTVMGFVFDPEQIIEIDNFNSNGVGK